MIFATRNHWLIFCKYMRYLLDKPEVVKFSGFMQYYSLQNIFNKNLAFVFYCSLPLLLIHFWEIVFWLCNSKSSGINGWSLRNFRSITKKRVFWLVFVLSHVSYCVTVFRSEIKRLKRANKDLTNQLDLFITGEKTA